MQRSQKNNKKPRTDQIPKKNDKFMDDVKITTL